MKAKFIFAFVLLVLVSFAYSATEADFVRVIDPDQNQAYYTHKSLEKSDLIIGTDKIFYGSGAGEVTVHLFVKGKVALVSKIGIEGTKAAISVKDFGGDTKGIVSKTAKSVEITKVIAISNDLQEFTFTLAFDPAQVGLQDEFDIVFYDALGNELARLDPFLSGYSYRKKFWIQGATTETNHVHRFDINAAKLGDDNALFWANTLADGNDVRFTKTDGTTEYTYNKVSFTKSSLARFDVYFPTWSTGDNNGYIYFGKAGATNDSNTNVTLGKYDDWEDGNYLTNPVWTKSGTIGTISDTTVFKNGAKSMRMDASAASGYLTAAVTGSHTTFSTWFRVDGNTTGVDGWYRFYNDANSTNNIGIMSRIGRFEYVLVGNVNTAFSPSIACDKNVWYKLRIDYTNGANTASFYIYDVNGVLKGSLLNQALVGVPFTANIVKLDVEGTPRVYNFDDTVYINYTQNAWSFGTSETSTGVITDFTYSVDHSLDPENGVNSATVTLTDASELFDSNFVSWKWYSNSVLFSTDQNTSNIYTAAADYNICLDVNAVMAGPVYYTDMECKTVTISQVAQNVAITYDINAYSVNDVNVIFRATATGTATNWWWQYDGTYIGTDQNINHVFTAADTDANICVTAKVSDVNKVVCDTFYISRTIMKIPKKEIDGTTLITPFALSTDTNPVQSYTALTADTNIFIFEDAITGYEILVDANDSLYFDRYYSVDSDSGTTTVQPYLADADTGASVKLITQSSVDYSTIGNVTVLVYKNIPLVGRVLIESVITDDKGEAFISGIINKDYEFEVYYAGLLVKTFNITITSTTIYILFNPSTASSLPAGVYATIAFIPYGSALVDFNSSFKFYQVFSYSGEATAASVRVWAKQIDVNGIEYDANLYSVFTTSSITSGYINTITYNTQLTGWDENLSLRIYAQICFTDGNCYTRNQRYYAPYSASGTTWDLLTRGTWNALGCSGETCSFLMLLSLLISICVVSWLAVTNPLPEVGNHLGIVFILVLGIFVVINWLHWALWLVAALATFFLSTVSREATR